MSALQGNKNGVLEMKKVRSPVDIMADFRMLQLNNFEDYEEVKQLRRDVKALLKNMREYVAYLVESGQPSLTEAVDKDILDFEDVSKRLHAVKKVRGLA